MRRRSRKFIGAVAMLSFVMVYALCAMVLSETRPVRQASWLVQTIYFAVIGLAWVLPLLPLVAWMERPDPEHASGGIDATTAVPQGEGGARQ